MTEGMRVGKRVREEWEGEAGRGEWGEQGELEAEQVCISNVDTSSVVRTFSFISTNIEPGSLQLCKVLQQKDTDLVLAAELGKALLDRNEELSRAR